MGWKEFGRNALQCTVCGSVETEERVALIEDCLVCTNVSDDEYESNFAEYRREDVEGDD